MKPFDLIRLIFGNLNRRKARVALTAIGVVIGTAAVVILVSLAIGLQRSANEQLYGIGDLTQILVSPSYGGEAAFAGSSGVDADSGIQEPRLLTNAALDELRAIPGVESVIPREYLYTGAFIRYQKLEAGVTIIGVATNDLADLGLEAQEGDTILARGAVVIGVLVPQNFYDPFYRPGQEPPAPLELIDQQIQMIITKWDDKQGKEIRKNLSLRVTGVLKESRGESDWTVYMSFDQIKLLNEWATNRRINYNKEGYSQVVVKVRDVDQVLDIADQITELGFRAEAPLSFVEGINSFFQILQIIFGGIGAIALLVAAIGIANTMTMSILERTREIGLMKAVGATNRDVLAIFLGEAAGIGFLGGMGGVIVGWLAGKGINLVAAVFFANQASEQGGIPLDVAIVTPLWLMVFSLIFSIFIGMISGLYPALRAATMIPVMALKYE